MKDLESLVNNEEALVSVIITTYKRPVEVLKRALKSVLAQTYKNFEVFVVNDCPEDVQGCEAIKKMIDDFDDKRILYIQNEKNSGACVARNNGIAHAKGKYVSFLDDDDEWLPEKIEKQVEGFYSDKVGLVYSPFYYTDKRVSNKIVTRGTASGNLVNALLWRNAIGETSMTMMPLKVLKECGGFDEQLLSSQDYELWLRIALKYEVSCVNIPLAKRYLLEESITNNYKKRKQGWCYCTEKYKDLYESDLGAYNCRITRMLNVSIENGDFKFAKELWKRAIKTRWYSFDNIKQPLKGLIKYVLVNKFKVVLR